MNGVIDIYEWRRRCTCRRSKQCVNGPNYVETGAL